MDFIIGCIIGVLFCVVVHVTCKPKPSGTFFMDFSNPEEEFCKLVMDEDLNSIYTKKKIVLRIDAKDFNPQE